VYFPSGISRIWGLSETPTGKQLLKENTEKHNKTGGAEMKDLNIKSLIIGCFIGVLLTVILYTVGIIKRYEFIIEENARFAYRIDYLTGEVWYSRGWNPWQIIEETPIPE